MSRYKLGDKATYQGKSVTIISVDRTNIWGQDEYHIEYNDQGHIPAFGYVLEHQLDPLPGSSSASPPRLCQCGAWAQKGFEDFHATWCRQYKDKRY